MRDWVLVITAKEEESILNESGKTVLKVISLKWSGFRLGPIFLLPLMPQKMLIYLKGDPWTPKWSLEMIKLFHNVA